MTQSSSSAAAITLFSGVIAASHLGKVSPALSALQNDLHLSLFAAGCLVSLMQFSGMTIGMMVGHYCDRLGAKRSILCGQAVLVVTSLLGATTESGAVMLVLRALESLGLLIIVLPTPGLLRGIVREEKLGMYMGLWGCYVATGTALSFFFGPVFIESFDWRVWWLLPGAGSTLVIILLVRGLPSQTYGAKKPITQSTSKRLFREKDAWIIGVAFALYAGQWLAVVGFAPTLFANHASNAVVNGALSATIALANIAGSLTAATLLQRGAQIQTVLRTGYAGMAKMTFLAFSPFTSATSSTQYVAILMFSAVGGLIPGSLYLLAVKSAPQPHLVASTIGHIQQLTSMGMCLLPPLLAALSARLGGWECTWWMCALSSLLAVSALAALHRNRPLQRQE